MTPAWLMVDRLPVGEVELAIDGEALRRELKWAGEELRLPTRIPNSVPIGGVTGKAAVFTVPAPPPESPDSAPTAGAGIAGSP